MPYYDKSSDDAMKDEDVDFTDVMNIMNKYMEQTTISLQKF